MSYEYKEVPQGRLGTVELPLTLSLHRGEAGVQALRDEWNGLALRHGTHFVHFPAWYGAELGRSGDLPGVRAEIRISSA